MTLKSIGHANATKLHSVACNNFSSTNLGKAGCGLNPYSTPKS